METPREPNQGPRGAPAASAGMLVNRDFFNPISLSLIMTMQPVLVIPIEHVLARILRGFLDKRAGEIDEELKGGMYAGDLNIYKNRYVFPCFNSKKQIIFVSARDVTGNNKVKWLLKGQKTNAVYPASNNLKHILQANRTVILCESVGDSISLSTCGIKNNLVLFGTEVNLSIINLLLKININKIIISTNDDSLSNGAGNKASVKIYNRLNRYFDKKQLEIKLPVGGNDWNEILVNKSKEEILKQFNNHEKQ